MGAGKGALFHFNLDGGWSTTSDFERMTVSQCTDSTQCAKAQATQSAAGQTLIFASADLESLRKVGPAEVQAILQNANQRVILTVGADYP